MAKALEVQALYGGSLQVALLEIGAIDEAHLEVALERTYGVRNAIDVRNDLPDDDALSMLRQYEAESMQLLPWRRDGKTLHVVMADPSNIVLLDKLSSRWSARIQLTVVSEPRLALLLETYFRIPCPEKLRDCLQPHEAPAEPAPPPPPARPAQPQGARTTQPGARPAQHASRPAQQSARPAAPPAAAPVVDPQAKEVTISDQGSGHMPSLSIGALDLPAPEAAPAPQATAAGRPSRPRFQTMELLVPLEQPAPGHVAQAPQGALPPHGAPAGHFQAMPPPPAPAAAAPAAPAPDVTGVTNLFQLQLNEVERREAVAPLVVAQLLKYFKRAAVLTVRRNIISGWEAAGPGVNRADFESMRVNLEEPRNVFEPVAKGAIHMGPIDAFPANFPLITAMGGVPAEFALIAPIKVKDRVVAMLYGETADEASLERTLKPVRNIAEAVGKTFLRLILLLRTEEKTE